MNLLGLVLISIFIYGLLLIKYQFDFPSDETIYIEDQKVNRIRNDDRLTIYEYRPPKYNTGNRLSELRLHRCFYSRQFHCTAPNDMQIQIIVFAPSESKKLYPNTHLLRLSQTSPINVYEADTDKYPLFKEAEYAEIPVIGGQSFVVPRGWWIMIDSPSHIMTKSF